MIRLASVDDVPFVYEIEKEIFSDAWSMEAFLSSIESDQCSFFVCTDECEKIIGYVIINYAADEATIDNIAVSPEARRCGYAQSLIDRVISFSDDNGIANIFLEVRASNLPAISLYEKNDFVRLQTRKNFYRNPVEDAFVYGRITESR